MVGCFASKRGVVSLQFSSMTSQTAETERVDVGERLRAIRRLRRATLKTVADRADLSESFLSQVERGRANASVGSLKRIAAALGVNVADLFEPNGSTATSARAPARSEAEPRVRFARPEVHAHATSARAPAGHRRRARRRRLDGRRAVHARRLRGAPGRPRGSRSRCSSARRCSSSPPATRSTTARSTPHRLVNIGGDPAEVMWIISPPSY